MWSASDCTCGIRVYYKAECFRRCWVYAFRSVVILSPWWQYTSMPHMRCVIIANKKNFIFLLFVYATNVVIFIVLQCVYCFLILVWCVYVCIWMSMHVCVNVELCSNVLYVSAAVSKKTLCWCLFTQLEMKSAWIQRKR